MLAGRRERETVTYEERMRVKREKRNGRWTGVSFSESKGKFVGTIYVKMTTVAEPHKQVRLHLSAAPASTEEDWVAENVDCAWQFLTDGKCKTSLARPDIARVGWQDPDRQQRMIRELRKHILDYDPDHRILIITFFPSLTRHGTSWGYSHMIALGQGRLGLQVGQLHAEQVCNIMTCKACVTSC